MASSLHHDPAGNQVGDGVGRTWKYDTMNRLAWASNGISTTTYGYAGMGRRVAVTGSTVKLYEVDEAGRRLGEYVKDATQPNGWRAVQEFVYLDAWRIVGIADYNAVGSMNALLAVVSDPITGTPRQVIDQDGDVRWDWDAREPFGYQVPNETPTVGKAALTFDARFPGQWSDDVSGTYHNNWREYWPRAGRYTQVDPIGLADGENPYAYVMGDPVGAVDPMGLYVKIGISFSAKFQAGNPGWAFLGMGVGRSQTFGVNIPNKWSEWKCWQLFAEDSVHLSAGVGAFAGAGVGLSVSESSGPMKMVETSSGTLLDVNAGWGFSAGAAVYNDKKSLFSWRDLNEALSKTITGFSAGGGSIGAGYGGAASIGQYGSLSIASPTIMDDCLCQ